MPVARRTCVRLSRDRQRLRRRVIPPGAWHRHVNVGQGVSWRCFLSGHPGPDRSGGSSTTLIQSFNIIRDNLPVRTNHLQLVTVLYSLRRSAWQRDGPGEPRRSRCADRCGGPDRSEQCPVKGSAPVIQSGCVWIVWTIGSLGPGQGVPCRLPKLRRFPCWC